MWIRERSGRIKENKKEFRRENAYKRDNVDERDQGE